MGFSFFSGILSRPNGTLERLLELLDEGLDQAVVGEAVVIVVADDHVIQNLNHKELTGLDEVSGQFPIFCRGRGVPRRVVVDKHKRRGFVF